MSRNEAQVRFELIDPALEADFRERMRSHFVVTTKDLLTTGVNVPACVILCFFARCSLPFYSTR